MRRAVTINLAKHTSSTSASRSISSSAIPHQSSPPTKDQSQHAKIHAQPVPNQASISKANGGPTKDSTPRKTMAELDEELRAKLEERSGNGGAAGIELEDGKAVAMKRGVRENMFRLI